MLGKLKIENITQRDAPIKHHFDTNFFHTFIEKMLKA
jgi:hypothetical protein